jgi:hypothetical protein
MFSLISEMSDMHNSVNFFYPSGRDLRGLGSTRKERLERGQKFALFFFFFLFLEPRYKAGICQLPFPLINSCLQLETTPIGVYREHTQQFFYLRVISALLD